MYDKYKRVKIPGRGWRAIGKHYGIPCVWVRRYIKRKYQENLDSSDAQEDEEYSMGDY